MPAPVQPPKGMTSIHMLHIETGLHPQRLRRVLEAAGVLSKGHEQITDRYIFVSKKAVRQIVDDEIHSLSMPDARAFINAPRSQMKLLVDAGFLRPRYETSTAGGHNKFVERDLKAFINRLLRNSTRVQEANDARMNIPDVAKRACCSAQMIIQAILDEDLQWTGRLISENGYLSVLVDLEEVRALVRAPDHGGISLRETSTMLATTDRVVEALIKCGHLKSFEAINPVNRCPQTVVARKEIDRFKRMYVSLHNLARSIGTSLPNLGESLTERGVEAAFDPETAGATFYRRSEIRKLKTLLEE